MIFEELKNLPFEDIKELSEKHNLTIKDNDNLYLIKYNRYNDKCNIEDEFVQKFRGTIFEKKTNKCLCHTFKRGISYKEFKTKHSIEDILVEESIDGTMINAYYYNGKWNFSTKGMIHSDKCFWFSRKSFYEMFLECLDFDLDLLDKKNCYSFIITHPENRIITKYTECKLYLVRVRNMDTFEIVERPELNVEYPKRLTFKSYEDLEKSLEELYYQKEGYMLFSKNQEDRVKVKGNNYITVSKLKGNQVNKTYNLLEKVISKRDYDYLNYFPEDRREIINIKTKVNFLINDLFDIYMHVHVNKINIVIPFKLKPLLYEIHGIYLKNKNNGGRYHTTKREIYNYIYNLDIPRIYLVLFKRVQYKNQI